jgi:hypothetical protein
MAAILVPCRTFRLANSTRMQGTGCTVVSKEPQLLDKESQLLFWIAGNDMRLAQVRSACGPALAA